jgi:hypothetical protein
MPRTKTRGQLAFLFHSYLDDPSRVHSSGRYSLESVSSKDHKVLRGSFGTSARFLELGLPTQTLV